MVKSAKQKKSLDLMGVVRDAFWLDPEEEVIEVVLDNGDYCAFDLEADDGSAFTSYSTNSFSQNSILPGTPLPARHGQRAGRR